MKRTTRRFSAAFAGLVLVGPFAMGVTTALAGLSADLAASPASATVPSLEAQFASAINADRSAAGLAPLGVDPTMTTVARAWTDVMVGNGSLSHNPALSTELPAGWTRYGENVGMGSGVASLMAAFMSSPEHRANILGPYDVMGVGTDQRADGVIFVTMDFMAGAGEAGVGSAAPGAVPAAPGTGASSPGASGSGASVAVPAANLPQRDPTAAAAAGYYVLGADGGVFSFGDAIFRGSVPGLRMASQAVLMALTPDQGGYWVLGADGGVFSFGDARFFGSVPGTGGRAVAVDLAPTPSGRGYWVLASNGAVFAFGDAPRLGSLTTLGVSDRAVRLIRTPSGKGYWILGTDGGVFSFGDAGFHGSLPGAGAHQASVSMATTPSGGGYWVLGSDGGVFSFGDAGFHGSAAGLGTAAQLAPTATGEGYYVLAPDGTVSPFGDAPTYGDVRRLSHKALDLVVVHP